MIRRLPFPGGQRGRAREARRRSIVCAADWFSAAIGFRITLWLVDTEGLHVWGDSYDGESDGLFDLLRRAADGALLGVIPGITGAEIDRVRRKDPRTLVAREILMQALPVLLKNDVESARKGLVIASRAMELDPDDALPPAWGAYCQARLFNSAATESSAAARDAALQLSARADAFDAGDPLVITARAATSALLELYEASEPLMSVRLRWIPRQDGHMSVRDSYRSKRSQMWPLRISIERCSFTVPSSRERIASSGSLRHISPLVVLMGRCAGYVGHLRKIPVQRPSTDF